MVMVKFGADVSDLEKGVGDAKAAIAGLTAAVAIGAAIGGAVAYFKSLGEEMISLERNAKEAGLSLREFQNLKFVANLGGVDDEKFVASLQQASCKLNDLTHGSSDRNVSMTLKHLLS
jgi:hypothetical protein